MTNVGYSINGNKYSAQNQPTSWAVRILETVWEQQRGTTGGAGITILKSRI